MEMNATLYRPFFTKAYAEMMDAKAEFEADVDEWYFHGDGRPRSEGGMGHRYPVCEHGVSTWTDFDCACWKCEDGRTWMDEAIALGRDRCLRTVERFNYVLSAPVDMPEELKAELTKWAVALF